jgi:nucleotide-binding universal stress UspA family protein
MRKLLVPVDSSDNAMRALEYAIGLAKENGPIELHIVTAHEAAFDNPRTLAYLPTEKLERLLQEHSESILSPAIEKAEAAGVTFTSEILVGPVPQAIVKRAEKLRCDSIVMGTRGMGAIGNLLMGSVATKVIHLTKLPVTLVK